jgi:hypothetical protein
MIEPIFHMNKIKFSNLTDLINNGCDRSINNKDTVNVFINLEPVLHYLVSPNSVNYFSINETTRIIEVMSNVLNLAAHYRLFFSKYHIFSKIYLYVSHPFDSYNKNKIIIENYRDYYKTKYSENVNNLNVYNIFNESIKLLKIIIDYIQNVYIIQSFHLESAMIPLIVTGNNSIKSVNFIVSKDLYEYQYTNKNFYILHPKRHEKSYIISKSNVMKVLQYENGDDNVLDLDSNYLSFILSVIGDKKRSISKIKRLGITSTIKTLNKSITTKVLPEGVYNINMISSLLKEDVRKQLLDNYYCTDLDVQFKMLNIQDVYTITDQIKDKYDNQALKELNDKYFKNHPIQLLELTSGDKYEYVEKKDIF